MISGLEAQDTVHFLKASMELEGLNTEAVELATTIEKDFEELGI